MNWRQCFTDLRRRLKRRKVSDHFEILYAERCPIDGAGQGVIGVRDDELIEDYSEALEAAYVELTSGRHGRSVPLVGVTGRIPVYVFEISDFFDQADLIAYKPPFMFHTEAWGDGGARYVPFIALSSRDFEPDLAQARAKVRADAAHEAVHAFNFTRRPPLDPITGTRMFSEPWKWFDEATAVFFESIILPGNSDWLRYAADWISYTDIPLDDDRLYYEAAIFLRYLAAKTDGPEFISRVWEEATANETALETVDRLLKQRRKIGFGDFFGAEYCVESYFTWEPANPGHQVYKRFGGRAVKESFALRTTSKVERTERLDHLSCHYFRFYPVCGAGEFEIEVNLQNPVLRAHLAEVPVGLNGQRRLVPLRNEAATGHGVVKLAGCERDHLVLVVSNCGTERTNNSAEYSFRVSIV